MPKLFKISLAFLLAVTAFFLGFCVIKGRGFSTRSGDWIPLSNSASLFLGIVVIFCGVWFLYFAIKNLRQSRRS